MKQRPIVQKSPALHAQQKATPQQRPKKRPPAKPRNRTTRPRRSTPTPRYQAQSPQLPTTKDKSLSSFNLASLLGNFFTIRSTVQDLSSSLQRVEKMFDSTYQMFEFAQKYFNNQDGQSTRTPTEERNAYPQPDTHSDFENQPFPDFNQPRRPSKPRRRPSSPPPYPYYEQQPESNQPFSDYAPSNNQQTDAAPPFPFFQDNNKDKGSTPNLPLFPPNEQNKGTNKGGGSNPLAMLKLLEFVDLGKMMKLMQSPIVRGIISSLLKSGK
ncbi:hypothetical protein [Mechercharimyces sp. CAU 1602]|uniref:hypothetical protein n=1 Tax=Mechercharimyces sp. CAU 1602 TaxID=2973933 RepID=UPI00216305DF|nr:hypothetical protein [Mechercharimyces sp. CAU 1602]MCS1350970.1 hypothetical protein [Mechercharimyces sp. CAU 1602]